VSDALDGNKKEKKNLLCSLRCVDPWCSRRENVLFYEFLSRCLFDLRYGWTDSLDIYYWLYYPFNLLLCIIDESTLTLSSLSSILFYESSSIYMSWRMSVLFFLGRNQKFYLLARCSKKAAENLRALCLGNHPFLHQQKSYRTSLSAVCLQP
jgi:hypothetical protein